MLSVKEKKDTTNTINFGARSSTAEKILFENAYVHTAVVHKNFDKQSLKSHKQQRYFTVENYKK